MTVYDIWLCDDEAVHLRGLEEKIARILPDVQLRSFEDPEAVRAAARACLPDILIMDIEFGPASGIALADDLCDGVSKNDPALCSGRTDGYKIVFFAADPADAGKFIDVRIDRADAYALYGTKL